MKRLMLAVCVLALVLSGCTEIQESATPMCDAEKSPGSLVLAAQSVPSASRIPCVASYPAGWGLNTMDIHSGLTSFTLDNDRAGDHALKVNLKDKCDIDGATEVASDEPGTRRYERIVSVDSGFRAVRTYEFDGGCVTYDFQFDERGQALINEASLAVGFITRGDVAKQWSKSRPNAQPL